MKELSAMEIYMQKINEIDLLTVEEERELAGKISNGDDEAREKMINANLRFVYHVAKEYQGQGLSLEDLVGYGNEGLIKAVERYDLEKKAKFSSYAVWWIRRAILRAIGDYSRAIRIPLNRIDELSKIKGAYAELGQGKGSCPSVAEVSEKTGFPQEKVDYLLYISRQPSSLNQ